LNTTAVQTLYNGSGQTKAINCPNQAALTVSASGNTQIVALSGTTNIYLCHMDFAASAASNFSLTYGTGSNCGTGTTTLTGVYQNVVTYSSPWDAVGPIIVPAGKALCINFVGTVTAGGFVTYAQF
jgi:hypothetical protein